VNCFLCGKNRADVLAMVASKTSDKCVCDECIYMAIELMMTDCYGTHSPIKLAVRIGQLEYDHKAISTATKKVMEKLNNSSSTND
jgi:hypothetical protein